MAVGNRRAQHDRLRPFRIERLGLCQQAVASLQAARTSRDVAGERQRVRVLAGLLRLLHQNPGGDVLGASFLLAQHELLPQAAAQEGRDLLRERIAQLERVAARVGEAPSLDVRTARAIDQTNRRDQAVAALFDASLDEAAGAERDRKSTRLNSSHLVISYAVFCLKKKKKNEVASHDCLY